MYSYTLISVMAAILPILGFFHEPSTITKTSPVLLEKDAYFGYSMAYDEKKILIGAPAANKFGEIFEFNLAENTSVKISSPLQKENNSEYDWFGATIKSYGPGSFVICAPRKIRHGFRLSKITRGRCYILSSQSKKWMELADLSVASRSYFNGGMDTFGWSVDVDKNRHIWIASPVIQNSSIKIYDDTTKLEYNTNSLATSLLNNGSDLISFGYSIVSGNFLSETGSDHAVSYTYGNDRHGKVFIFEKRMKKLELPVDKDSVGSMYGAVLCKASLGHRRASLLVGAPTFAMPQDGYDRGAVYLYVPEDSSKNFTLKRLIKGEKDAGYFGQAIISLGDMDGDQKDEVAIGAPFEEGGRGAVYIYSGAGLLSDRPWTQRIQRGAHSFGFSLLPLPNYSGNGLNGLSVGAPFENQVYVITPIPSITVNVDAILPNSQNGRKDPNYVEITLVVDVIYPVLPKDIIAKLEVKLEIEHPDATLEHGINNGTIKFYNWSLNTTVTSYKETPRILTPTNGKFDVAISYTISVKLLNESEKDGEQNEGRVLLSERSNVVKRGVLWVSECDADEHCIPDLSAELLTGINEPYTVGSSDKEYLTLVVHNEGKTAYTPCVVVNVQTVRVLRRPPGCALDPTGLVCTSPHPIRHNGDWEISKIELEMDSLTSKLHDNIKSINILYDIYNDCNNKSDHKVSYKKSFALHYGHGIHLMGISIPSEPVEITSSDLHNVTRLQHHYTIMNNGVVNWAGVTCDILLQKKNYLRYPVEVMMRRGPIMIPCPFDEGKTSKAKDTLTAVCNIGDFHKNNIIEVLIDVEVLPNFLISGNALKSDDVSIPTQLTLRLLKEESIIKKITTTLVIAAYYLRPMYTYYTYEIPSLHLPPPILTSSPPHVAEDYLRKTITLYLQEKDQQEGRIQNEYTRLQDLLQDHNMANDDGMVDGTQASKLISIWHAKLVLNKKSVPGWVIVIAVLFGLLIILLIAFILYKYNCFERKNKKMLEDLKTKKSIRRHDDIVESDGNYKVLQEERGNNLAREPSVGHSVDQSVAPGVDHSVDQSVAPCQVHRIDHIVEAEIN